MGVALVGKAATKAFLFWTVLYIVTIHIGMLFTSSKVPSLPDLGVAQNGSMDSLPPPTIEEEEDEEEEEEEEIVEEIEEEIVEEIVYVDKIIEEEEIIYVDEEEEEEEEQQPPEEEEEEEVEEVIVVKKKKFPREGTVDKLKKQWETHRRNEKKLAKENKKAFSLLQSIFDDRGHREDAKRPGTPDSEKFKVDELDSLLWYDSLSILGTHDLERSFQKLFDELARAIADPDNVRWDVLDMRWFDTYPRSDGNSKDVPAQECPSQMPDIVIDDTFPIEDMARVSDLRAKEAVIHAALKERLERVYSTTAGSLPPLWNTDLIDRLEESMKSEAKEGVQRQEEVVDDAIEDAEEKLEEAIVKRQALAAEHADDNCIQPSDVEWLVDEGLDALERKRDLRSVLVKLLRSLDAESANNVILDAMLPWKPPHKPPAKDKINLRQIMDTPLLSQQSPHWIDFAVDQVSGHIDFLDQAIDNILQGQGKDDDSVGKVLVANILKLAGKVQVPNLLKDVPDPGALRP